VKKLNAIFFIRIFAIVITLNIVSAIFPVQISAQQDGENYQEFYDQLSPYGQGVENSDYGYIWIPAAGPDFTPYLSNGYWLLTEYGWTWVSDYDWGWATFHYGRWDYNGSYGWFWVPDYEWGPSWVTWRWSKGYYGWAPMRPGVSINITFDNYNDIPNDRWIFVRDRDIERHDIGRNRINRRQNFNIMPNSTVIDKTYYDDRRHATYVAGPGREDVQKIIGRKINPIAVHEKDRPGQSVNKNQLQIYRPIVQKNNTGRKPAPSEVTNPKDVKRISERNDAKQSHNIQQQNGKTEKQQPVMSIPTRNNNKDNSIQQWNANSPNKNKEQQPAMKSIKNIDTKNNSYQPKKSNPLPIENSKVQSSQPLNINARNNSKEKVYPFQQRDQDPTKKNSPIERTTKSQQTVTPKINTTERTPKERTMNVPTNNKNTDRQPEARKMNAPKDNNNTDQRPVVRTINAPRDNNVDRSAKSSKKDEKREK
jgi:hypothetical protein